MALLAIVLGTKLNGATTDRAIALAKERAGPGYRYAIRSIQWGGGHNRAVVAAYDDKEIKYVAVEWPD